MLGLADADGHLDGAALYELADAVGLSDTSIRLTVRRLVEAGLATSTGRGRGSVLRLTPEGLAVRVPDLGWTAMAYRQDATDGPGVWDGEWHLVSFEIPETQRAGRDALRTTLVDLLGAPLGGALYVSPHEWEAWAIAVATRHGVRDLVTTITTRRLEVGGERDPRRIAARLWPLVDLQRDLAEFVSTWEPVATDPPAATDEAARVAFLASQRFEELMRRDPLLPVDAQPDGWAGPQARLVYRELIERLGATHELLRRADVFSAFLDVVERTSSMSDAAFGWWLFDATSR